MFLPWLIELISSGAMLILKVSGSSGSFPRPLKREEEERYLALAAQGDIEARNKLVEHNLRLVAHIVKNS